MVDYWTRMLNRTRPAPKPPEPLSADKIDAGYRLYWTKMALTWDDDRRTQITERVAAAVAAPDFEDNMLERRFTVEGLDDSAHSGASLLALVAVLRALDAYESGDDAP